MTGFENARLAVKPNKEAPEEAKLENALNANTMRFHAAENIQQQFNDVLTRHNGNVETAKARILSSEKLFDQDVDIPENAQLQKEFKKLGQLGTRVIKSFEPKEKKPLTPEVTDENVRVLYDAMQDVRKQAQESQIQLSPESATKISQALAQYDALFLPQMYAEGAPRNVSANMQRQMDVAGKLMLVTLGGAYTAFSVIAGWKSKNFTTAFIGAGLTAAAIFGPKRLFEGKNDRVVREMKFLESKEMDAAFDRWTGAATKENLAKAVENIQGKATMGKIVTIEQKTGMKDEDKRTEIEKALQMDSQTADVQALLKKMLDTRYTNGMERASETPNDDLAIFMQLVEGGKGKETKETILKYIAKGGRSTDIKIALDPEKLGAPAA